MGLAKSCQKNIWAVLDDNQTCIEGVYIQLNEDNYSVKYCRSKVIYNILSSKSGLSTTLLQVCKYLNIEPEVQTDWESAKTYPCSTKTKEFLKYNCLQDV